VDSVTTTLIWKSNNTCLLRQADHSSKESYRMS
jgi:hypothetical protein